MISGGWRGMAALLPPGRRASLVLGVTALLGLGITVLAGFSTDGVRPLAAQIPWLVSGGLGGVALTGVSVVILGLHEGRCQHVRDMAARATLARDLDDLADGLSRALARRRGHGSVEPVPQPRSTE